MIYFSNSIQKVQLIYDIDLLQSLPPFGGRLRHKRSLLKEAAAGSYAFFKMEHKQQEKLHTCEDCKTKPVKEHGGVVQDTVHVRHYQRQGLG